MPITNFPGGVASFGIPQFGTGLYDVPCGEVIFVCNRSGVVNGDGTSRDKPMLSIADAVVSINTSIPSKAAMILVLANHAENVTGSNIFSASLVNTTTVVIPQGTRIVSEGSGSLRATLTFTAAASTIAFAAVGCTLENFILQGPQTGVTTVAAMVTVTAASCKVIGCDKQMATSATALVTTAISLSSAANDFRVTDCPMVYATTGTPTAWLTTVGTAGPARVIVLRNSVFLPLSATTGGCIDVSANSVTPPLNWVITDNTFANLTAASTVAIKGVAAWTAYMADNDLITLAASAATAVTTAGNLAMFRTQLCQQAKQSIAITNGGPST